MSKKILEVSADASRQMEQTSYGYFYSEHKPEDIKNWLRDIDADSSIESFDSMFGGEWEDVDAYCIDNLSLDFSETDSVIDEDDCEYDEDIQKFLDDAPKREMEKINYRFKDFMGSVQGMKDTALQLLNDFKKVVKTDDVEKLPEEQQKIYQTLKSLITP